MLKGQYLKLVDCEEEKETGRLSLKKFAELTGFPQELIKKELNLNTRNCDVIDIADLRKAMLSYLESPKFDQDTISLN